jgi:hypothetical protein
MDLLLSVASSRALRQQFTRSSTADAMAALRLRWKNAAGRASFATVPKKQRFHPTG